MTHEVVALSERAPDGWTLELDDERRIEEFLKILYPWVVTSGKLDRKLSDDSSGGVEHLQTIGLLSESRLSTTSLVYRVKLKVLEENPNINNGGLELWRRGRA